LSELLHRQPESLPSFEEDERWALVQRVAASRHFVRAPQLREILVYISRRVLADHAVSIGEQEIGSKVLGRRADFSPNDDNIVRVQVRHLRKKLEDYFSTDGAEEPLVLTIPKGAYIPHFELRPQRPAPERLSLSPAAGLPHAPKATPSRTVAALVALLLVGALLASVVWWRQRGASRNVAEEAPVAHEDALWSKIFTARRQTSIVAADTNLVMIQDILDVDIPLQEYLNGGYPEELLRNVSDRKLQAALRLISTRQYTSLGDEIIAAKLLELSHRYGAQANLRYSRHISVREFKIGNFVLIGSRRGIPWEQLFESQLNFSLEEDQATHRYHLRNKSPLPGERQVYGASSGATANQDTYADIALLPNLAGTGYVLLLAGIDMPATEAAGELVTQPDFGATLTKLLNSKAGQPPASYFEFLLEAKATGGTGGGGKIVSFRRIEGQRPAP